MSNVLDEMEHPVDPLVESCNKRTRMNWTANNEALRVAPSDSKRFLVLNASRVDVKLSRLLVGEHGMN